MSLDKVLFIIITPFNYSTEQELIKLTNPTGRVEMLGLNQNNADINIEMYNYIRLESYQVVFIDQCANDIKTKLKTIVSHDNRKLIVWTHQNNVNCNTRTYNPVTCEEIEIPNDKLITCDPFSHGESVPDKILKACLSQNSKLLTDILFNYVRKRNVNEIHKLRSQLLANFSVIHLALQDSFEKNWTVKKHPLIFDNKCKKACEIIKGDNLKEKLDEFLSYAEDDNKTGINRKYAELKGKIEKLCKVIINNNKDGLADFKDLLEDKKGGNGLIEEFAMTLEKVVETVERRKF